MFGGMLLVEYFNKMTLPQLSFTTNMISSDIINSAKPQDLQQLEKNLIC